MREGKRGAQAPVAEMRERHTQDGDTGTGPAAREASMAGTDRSGREARKEPFSLFNGHLGSGQDLYGKPQGATLFSGEHQWPPTA